MKVFTMNEVENAFEIGRIVQHLVNIKAIEGDSKDFFNLALPLAIQFEEKFPNTEDYYTDIEEFVLEKFMKEFCTEDPTPPMCKGCVNSWAFPSHVNCNGCARMYHDNYQRK